MFAVYDVEMDEFIVGVDCCGTEFGGTPMYFTSYELAEAFLIWLCAWLIDDEDKYSIKKVIV